MKSSVANISIAIIHLLKTRRDGLVLINGPWGSGKTYFIHNVFPKIYTIKTIYYISLLGIQSLSDFKSRIIDKVYLENMDEFERAASITANSLSISTGNSRSAGVVDKIIKTLTNSVKESVLSNLSGLFIIDDLERITDQNVLNEIIGYCHNLYTKSDDNNLDYLLIGNFTREFKGKIEHQEKLISDIIFFEPSREDLNDIISEKNNYLTLEHLGVFLNILMKYDIQNLRVVNRITDKLKPIYQLRDKYNTDDMLISMDNVIVCISCAIIAVNIHGQKPEDFDKYYRSYQKDKKTASLDIQIDELLATSTGYLTIKILPYSLGMVSYTDIEPTIYGRNNELSIIEKALSSAPQFYEADEKEILELLINTIKKNRSSTLQEWLKATINYGMLIKEKYIDERLVIDEDYLIKKADTFTHDELSKYFGDIKSDTYSIYRESSKSNISSYLLDKYKKHIKEKIISGILLDIKENGWAKFNSERLDNIEDQSKYKPFQILGTKVIIQCIWNSKWTVLDIVSFDNYLHALYNFSNIYDYLSGEKKHLIQMNTALEFYLGNRKKSFRFGAVLQLKTTIERIISRL